MTEVERLALARKQLARVHVAWLDPIDWSDLLIYGFLAIENAVVAAADHLGITWERTHPSKAAAAKILAEQHGLADVSELLVELNGLRKSEAYGEFSRTASFSAEELAIQAEAYIEAVAAIVENK